MNLSSLQFICEFPCLLLIIILWTAFFEFIFSEWCLSSSICILIFFVWWNVFKFVRAVLLLIVFNHLMNFIVHPGQVESYWGISIISQFVHGIYSAMFRGSFFFFRSMLSKNISVLKRHYNGWRNKFANNRLRQGHVRVACFTITIPKYSQFRLNFRESMISHENQPKYKTLCTNRMSSHSEMSDLVFRYSIHFPLNVAINRGIAIDVD